MEITISYHSVFATESGQRGSERAHLICPFILRSYLPLVFTFCWWKPVTMQLGVCLAHAKIRSLVEIETI
jgi:hypothetical protein